MFYSILFISLLFNAIRNITGTIDCNYYAATGSHIKVEYKGCKNDINTKHLKNSNKATTPIYSFKGIPFAEPPVGVLRFARPLPKTFDKSITYDATYYRNACMQPLPLDIPQLPSEDCLYMNVWTPTLNSSAKLPVMFWIYGGIFLIGSGSQLFNTGLYFRVYDGSLLAANDVVLITFNYRLGVFGFMNGNREDAPGNIGLWDQAMAMNWTRQNIEKFGGDPDNILIFGQSAGSMSVSSLIVSPITRNWFKKAICQSGTAYVTLFSRPKDYMFNISRKYASNATGLGCNGPNWIECLRRLPADKLLAAQTASLGWNSDQPYPIADIAPFQPIFGDQFLPIPPNKAVKEGCFRKDIKLLIGHLQNEGVILNFQCTILRGLIKRYDPLVPSDLVSKFIIRNDIKNFIINNNTIGVKISDDYTKNIICNPIDNSCSNTIRRAANHVFADYFLTCPCVLFGSHISKNQNSFGKVYQYRFTYITSQSVSKSSCWTEATHSDEVPLVFGVPVSELQSTLWNDEDRKMSREMVYIWTHFAKYDSLPKVNGYDWPPYSCKSDGSTNASYLVLHPDDDKLGKVYVDKYRGYDIESSYYIQNCFEYWEDIINGQF